MGVFILRCTDCTVYISRCLRVGPLFLVVSIAPARLFPLVFGRHSSGQHTLLSQSLSLSLSLTLRARLLPACTRTRKPSAIECNGDGGDRC